MTAVLVTAGGGIVGEGIVKCLRLANSKGRAVSYRVLVADADPKAAGLYRADEGFIIPQASSPDYLRELMKVAKANDVSAVFVGADEELEIMARSADKIKKETGAVVVTNSLETIAIGSDKWKTYQFMKKHALPRAESALPEDAESFVNEFGYPVVVKPREGHGSEGFFVARDGKERDYAEASITKRGWRPMLQEYLADGAQEFTTGVAVGKGAKVLSSISMRRTLKGGQTYKAFVDDFPEVRRAAEKVAAKLGGPGPINVQARVAKGEAKAFEINPRFSASCPIRAAAGVNEPDILFRSSVLGETATPKPYAKLVCMRYWNEVYVPYSAYEEAKVKGRTSEAGSWIPDYF
jgi:carbamoyl-phosphate synthase large subunit